MVPLWRHVLQSFGMVARATQMAHRVAAASRRAHRRPHRLRRDHLRRTGARPGSGDRHRHPAAAVCARRRRSPRIRPSTTGTPQDYMLLQTQPAAPLVGRVGAGWCLRRRPTTCATESPTPRRDALECMAAAAGAVLGTTRARRTSACPQHPPPPQHPRRRPACTRRHRRLQRWRSQMGRLVAPASVRRWHPYRNDPTFAPSTVYDVAARRLRHMGADMAADSTIPPVDVRQMADRLRHHDRPTSAATRAPAPRARPVGRTRYSGPAGRRRTRQTPAAREHHHRDRHHDGSANAASSTGARAIPTSVPPAAHPATEAPPPRRGRGRHQFPCASTASPTSARRGRQHTTETAAPRSADPTPRP